MRADARVAARHGLGRRRRAAPVGVEDRRDGQVRDRASPPCPALEHRRHCQSSRPASDDLSEQAMCQLPVARPSRYTLAVDDCIQPRPGAYLSGRDRPADIAMTSLARLALGIACVALVRVRECRGRRLPDAAGAPDRRLSRRRPDRHPGAPRRRSSASVSASNS